jgi:carboxyl-terminal processing protease
MSNFAKFQKKLSLVLLCVGVFYGGYYFGKRGLAVEVKQNPPEVKVVNRSPESEEVDFALFWSIWETLRTRYLERPVDTKAMMYGAISGMVASLGDPYTSFLPPVENELVNNSLNGIYEGIGAELGIKEDQLVIVAPLDGSPAKTAGVKPGDKILAIEGENTIGISLREAVSKIRGEAGTIVSLTIQRDNEDPVIIRIKRGKIVIDSVSWEDKGNGTAYIRISRFDEDTNTEWMKIASELNVQMEELDALVVDVRGNPGGYLSSAVFVAGDFVANKPIVYQELATGEQLPMNSDGIASFKNLPIFVLIDEGSASASEILAAALKHYNDATLVGKKTFGKGTIQDAKDYKDGSGLHITIAKWLTPSKEWIHGVGVEPDVEVDRREEGETDATVDMQLEKVLELAGQI